MSCSKNSDKVKKVAVRTGITALASGFAITSVLMAKRIFTRRKDKNSAKVDAAELDRQVEELKYLEAQSIAIL